MTKKVRTYSDEFKAEAVKKISDNNTLSQPLQSSLALPCKRYQIGITANQGKLVGTEQYDPEL